MHTLRCSIVSLVMEKRLDLLLSRFLYNNSNTSDNYTVKGTKSTYNLALIPSLSLELSLEEIIIADFAELKKRELSIIDLLIKLQMTIKENK